MQSCGGFSGQKDAVSANILTSFAMFESVLPWLAGIMGLLIGLAALIRKWDALASWLFFIGMLLLAAERVIESQALSIRSPEHARVAFDMVLVVQSFLPGIWLPFSVIYGRRLSPDFLSKWRIPILCVVLLLPLASFIFAPHLVALIPAEGNAHQLQLRLELPAKFLILILLISVVAILFHMERTFRSAVGITRWRIKYFFLGILLIFGVKLFTLSQALLYSEVSSSLGDVSSISLILASGFMAVAYSRRGFGEFQIYPSRVVLERSFTVIFSASYLMIIGVLAHITAQNGGSKYFPVTAFVVLIGVTGLAVLLLSDRVRGQIGRLVSVHFHRPRYDFRLVWNELTAGLATVLDRSTLCENATEQIAKTFQVHSVTAFLYENAGSLLIRIPSEANDTDDRKDGAIPLDVEELRKCCQQRHPFDLESVDAPWAMALRENRPSEFLSGGNRIVVPMLAGNHLIGVLVLADRVNGASYTQEELDLLERIADQVAASLLNVTLTEELVRAREMEAFHAVSSFFVHDLKNAAHRLNLMLQNLPVHFDNPEFREDALRGVSSTVDRINEMITRLSSLKEIPSIEPADTDLNELVREVLDRLGAEMEKTTVRRNLRPLPRIKIDLERMRSVLTNLMLNAREATGGCGDIRVETRKEEDNVVLSVEDDGCGMTEDFIRRFLFQPFHSTKSCGLGIGMYQSRMIVEAHRGMIQVESTPDEGTIFRVCLPL